MAETQKAHATPRVIRPYPVTAEQVKILAALDWFRFLTAEQGVRLGLAPNAAKLRQMLRPLIVARLVRHTPDTLISGITKLARLHYISTKGAHALQHAGYPDLAGARRTIRDGNEILHRRGVVDIHLAVHLWTRRAGLEPEQLITDFETGSRGRVKATKLDAAPFPADALAWITGPDGKRRALFIEFDRGGERGDLQRVRKKWSTWRRIATNGEVAEEMESAGGVRFLIVFKDAAFRDKALKKWPDRNSPDWQAFFVKALPDLWADFNGGWLQPSGKTRRLFSFG